MTLTLLPASSVQPGAPVSPPQRPVAAAPTPAQPAANPVSAPTPAGLRSDRFALMFWLICAGFMSLLLLKDLVVALFAR